MMTKYGIKVEKEVVRRSLKRLSNQTYKILPMREEGQDWVKPLETIIEELCGMSRILTGQQDLFFRLLNKLEGLFVLTKKDDFLLYRRIIFECMGLIEEILKDV